MNLCLSMWSFHRRFFQGEMSVIEFLGESSARGIRVVELLDVFWRDKASELPQVQHRLAELGLKVGAYAVSNDFAAPDAQARRQALQAVLDGIETAQALKAPVVRVFSGDLKAGIEFATAFAWVVEGLREAAGVAERCGIRLALENHGLLAGQAEQVRQILEAVASPALGSTFDCGNFLLVGQSPYSAWEALAPYVVHVHVKDVREVSDGQGWPGLDGRRYIGTVCGEGQVPLKELLHEMARAGYRGAVSLEYEGPGDEGAGVDQSLAYLRSACGWSSNGFAV